VDEEFMRRLQALADRLGVRRTVLAREIICKALDKARV
jgi:predicted DNA-binding protein